MVRQGLEALSSKSSFNYMRLPDARAGSFQPTVADFLAVHRGFTHFLEVKEVQHAYRLPAKNFSLDQRARLAAFRAAGAMAWVPVYFTPLKIWRCTSAAYFSDASATSWDMRDLPVVTLNEFFTLVFSNESSS